MSPWPEFRSDLKYGVRTFVRNPAFSVVVVLMLALGVGANTAIFSLIDAVVLKALPVKDPDKLVHFLWIRRAGDSNDTFSYPFFRNFRDRNKSFSGIFAFKAFTADLGVDGNGEIASGQMVSGNYYSVLGVNTLLGRPLMPSDDLSPDTGPVAVISYGYWKRRFSGDLAVIGRKITLNGSPFTIVGVTHPTFYGHTPGSSVDVSVPVTMITEVQPALAMAGTKFWVLEAPNRGMFSIMGRLKPGVSEKEAHSDVSGIYSQALQELVAGSSMSPEAQKKSLERKMVLESGARGLAVLRDQFSKPLMILMGMVGLLLLIACANVANLLLARANRRQAEIALRVALGAKRVRLIRQLLTENLVFAVAGTTLGCFLAFLANGSLLGILANSAPPILISVTPDVTVLAFTAGIGLITTFLFGVVPALSITKVHLSHSVKKTAGDASHIGKRFGLSKTLVVSQVAFSLILLIGAAALVRTLQNLKNTELGYGGDNLLLTSVSPHLTGYKGVPLRQLYKLMLDKLGATPGVRSATFSGNGLMRNSSITSAASIRGYVPQPGENMEVKVNYVGPDYFKTLGVTLIKGRDFMLADSDDAPKVAVINQVMADRFFKNENPIGRQFDVDGVIALEIVGVVKPFREQSPREPLSPAAYLPALEANVSGVPMSFEIHTVHDPISLAPDVMRVIHGIDGNIPISSVKTLDRQLDDSLVQERLIAYLGSLFGLLALVLASVGLYGVMAYVVSRRTNEIGVRMALGARRVDVTWMVLRESIQLIVLGIIIGIPLAIAGLRSMSSTLYGLRAVDPFTVSIAISLMIVVAIFASYIPARRAALVAPMEALRYE